ncbi:MAG: hypothetical protein QOD75_2279 [Blastocatellia bacterium]|nr:hypothetical protein [Blastocatellia bacterium]
MRACWALGLKAQTNLHTARNPAAAAAFQAFSQVVRVHKTSYQSKTCGFHCVPVCSFKTRAEDIVSVLLYSASIRTKGEEFHDQSGYL